MAINSFRGKKTWLFTQIIFNFFLALFTLPSASAMFAIDDQNMQTNVLFQDRMVKMG